jgi:hypothetical protein
VHRPRQCPLGRHYCLRGDDDDTVNEEDYTDQAEAMCWENGNWMRWKSEMVSCVSFPSKDLIIDPSTSDAFNPDNIFYERTDARDTKNIIPDESDE